MASKPQYSLASSSRGTSACSKRVVPHVFKMKRLLETNMLLSLKGEKDKRHVNIWNGIIWIYHSNDQLVFYLHMCHSTHSNITKSRTTFFAAMIRYLLAGKTNIRAECMSLWFPESCPDFIRFGQSRVSLNLGLHALSSHAQSNLSLPEADCSIRGKQLTDDTCKGISMKTEEMHWVNSQHSPEYISFLLVRLCHTNDQTMHILQEFVPLKPKKKRKLNI